jgi:ubiquinone/menaquinone biosynthesis C-methylase UbiE
MNNLINEASLRELQLRGDEKILDVGCGMGQFTRLMSRVVEPSGKVIGIERDADQIEAGKKIEAEYEESASAEIRQGDALNLPLQESEWGTFDVVHSRFLLEHLPDPEAAVAGMIRAAKPGGRIVLSDDDHDVLRLWPEPAGFMELWHAYIQSYFRNSTDPYIGRRLVSIMQKAGAEPRRNTWMWFGACAGNPAFEILSENLIGVVGGARPAILDTGLITSNAFDETIHTLIKWSTLPDAALWYSICWAEAMKPKITGKKINEL